MKKLQESTDQGLYYLHQPGNGISMPLICDPQINLQKWGANLRTNSLKIENDLRGMNRPLTRDCLEYAHSVPSSELIRYPLHTKEITHQSRTVAPAWTIRGVEQPRWETPLLDPQENIILPFQAYTDTRNVEKDNFKYKN
jgi:hypothetical protein